MWNLIRKIFFGTVYVQIWEERLKIVHVETQSVYDEIPWIALDLANSKKPIVKAIGNEAYGLRGVDGVEASNPFAHPRLLVNSFQKAEKVLQHGVRTVYKATVFHPRPLVVMHPRERLEGGITEVECRLFRELALGAGAREVRLHIGDELNIYDFDFSKVNEP